MSDHQGDSGDRVVITASDFTRLETPPVRLPVVESVPPKPKLAWWGILACCLLTLSLPLLCIAATGILLSLRGRDAQKKLWTRFLCTLLIISGLLSSVAASYLYFLYRPEGKVPSHLPLGLVSHDLLDAFPILPAEVSMTPMELAARTKPLVFIIMPEPGMPLQEAYLDNGPLGAAVLLQATKDGYLLATNRHVTDPPLPFAKKDAARVLVVSAQGSYAYARVVARHNKQDLALLWISRRYGRASFRQPITRVPQAAVGSSVFVIGHPQGLFFTLSSGLVSRVADEGMVQLSAPISPGNSGGPVYDSLGSLLGIVTYTVDKSSNPNAENLNFATPADVLLSAEGWEFRDEGKSRLNSFLEEGSKTGK